MWPHVATFQAMSRQIGIRTLKNSLSEVLRSLEPGEPVEVTDRGRVVARLLHVADEVPSVGWYTRMLREGNVRLAEPDPPPLDWGPRVAIGAPGLAQQLIDQDRGE
jgi:prevent-host-death family protein